MDRAEKRGRTAVAVTNISAAERQAAGDDSRINFKEIPRLSAK